MNLTIISAWPRFVGGVNIPDYICMVEPVYPVGESIIALSLKG